MSLATVRLIGDCLSAARAPGAYDDAAYWRLKIRTLEAIEQSDDTSADGRQVARDGIDAARAHLARCLAALLAVIACSCGDNLTPAHDNPDRCCALLPDAGAVRTCVAVENETQCAATVGCSLPDRGIFVVFSDCSDAGVH